MASFSNDVKEELCTGITDKDKRYACLYGILLYCKNFTENHICFTTECKGFAELFNTLVKNVFDGSVAYSCETGVRKNGQPVYSVSVSGKENVKRITDTYNIKLEKR